MNKQSYWIGEQDVLSAVHADLCEMARTLLRAHPADRESWLKSARELLAAVPNRLQRYLWARALADACRSETSGRVRVFGGWPLVRVLLSNVPLGQEDAP